MFGRIFRNIWQHSAKSLRTFSGIFGNITRNVWRHSPECLSLEYNIPPIPHVPRIPLPVPLFLSLYTAVLKLLKIKLV